MKILSPAGNFESLKMAIYNGADEVYLGINDFNARNNIDGFTMDNLCEAVDFAHIFGVKVLLAINILFSDDELIEAVKTVVDAFNFGVDAFIVQDLGLAKILSENFPQVELHASTQMGLHNLEGVQAILKFGFKRIVLARETPLSEIKRIKDNVNVEIEYFTHGALCVSFSGNCYLSSYLLNASGNRGKCKQLCRLPYTLEYHGKKLKHGYLLSAKDFNMTKRLKDLENAGVDVLKIEGRARRPFYTAIATKTYYNAVRSKEFDVDTLNLAFNRNFTQGYFNGNGNIISDIQNHIGIEIGRVEKVVPGKNFNEVFFTSNRVIVPKSTLKTFNDQKETATISAYDLTLIKKGFYRLTTKNKINRLDTVRLVVDEGLEKETLSYFTKKQIDITIHAYENSPITAKFTVNGTPFTVVGDICLKAEKHPVTKQEIIENFTKSDLFDAQVLVDLSGNIFIAKQKLNEFRRKVFANIKDAYTFPYRKNVRIDFNFKTNPFISLKNFQIIDDYSKPLTANIVIYSPSEYDLLDVKEFMSVCERQGKSPYLDTPPFALEKDIQIINNIVNQTNIGIVANNYYALNLTENVIIGAGLNVYNSVTANVFSYPVICAESKIAERIDFPYMTLRHCPMKSHLGATCEKCTYKDGFSYRMDNGKILKLKRKKLSTCTFFLTD